MEIITVLETGNGPHNVQFFNIIGESGKSGSNTEARKVIGANFNCGG